MLRRFVTDRRDSMFIVVFVIIMMLLYSEYAYVKRHKDSVEVVSSISSETTTSTQKPKPLPKKLQQVR